MSRDWPSYCTVYNTKFVMLVYKAAVFGLGYCMYQAALSNTVWGISCKTSNESINNYRSVY